VNGTVRPELRSRQDDLDVAEQIANCPKRFELKAGDIIYFRDTGKCRAGGQGRRAAVQAGRLPDMSIRIV